MNLNQIIRKVEIDLDDSSILRSDIVTEINEIRLFVAAVTRLPSLLVQKEPFPVAAGTTEEPLPSNFHHNLFHIYSETHDTSLDDSIETNTAKLYRDYNESETGPLSACCEENNIFYMRPKLSAKETLLISYYKKPTDLEDDTTTPPTCTIIPAHLHQPILVDGAVSRLLKIPKSPEQAQLKAQSAVNHNTGIALIKKMYPYGPKARPKLRRKVRDF